MQMYSWIKRILNLLIFTGVLFILDIILPESFYNNIIDHIHVFRIGGFMILMSVIVSILLSLKEIKRTEKYYLKNTIIKRGK